MIEVRFLRAPSNDLLIGFVVEGHAGFDEYGRDIVCAAVSAITQAAVLGLREILGDVIFYEKRAGYLAVKTALPSAKDPGVKAILRTVELAIMSISKDHPEMVCLIR
jgi:uncharacterized protein YsxB (DUF464 family)